MSSSPSISTQAIMCPECRFRPSRKYIMNICQDAGKIQKIPESDLYNNINYRSVVWIYEGRNNGWWYYDYDLQDELENSWKEGSESLDWYICGQKVHIDLLAMKQTNKQTNAVRAINRLNKIDIDACGLLIKGVAGMMPANRLQ